MRACGTKEEVFSSNMINELYKLEAGRLESMYGGFLSAIKTSENQ